jgi:predicted metal-dependent hydrolase
MRYPVQNERTRWKIIPFMKRLLKLPTSCIKSGEADTDLMWTTGSRRKKSCGAGANMNARDWRAVLLILTAYEHKKLVDKNAMHEDIIFHIPNIPLGASIIHTENSLRHYFEERLGRPIFLMLTENSTSMLSARMRERVLRIRLHRMFLNADSPVIDEIVLFLKNRRNRMTLFRKFIRDNREHLTKKLPNKVMVKTGGTFHDLRELYDEINKEYFGNVINAAITWGARSPRYAVRKRTLGSYSDRSNTIRINPVLDKSSIPRSVVAFVVYHEMLHAAMGVALQGKRRSVHSREFKKREKLFADYEKARAWERGG